MKAFKTVIRAMTFLGIALTLTACPDNHDWDGEEPEPIPTPGSVKVTQSVITGTWFFDHTQTGSNYDYFSFDGKGRGLCALLADQYKYEDTDLSWETSSDPYKSGLGYLRRMDYTIDGNVIIIKPDIGGETIKVEITSVSNGGFSGNLSAGISARFTASKESNSPEWFTEEGPASEDLAAEFVGFYRLSAMDKGWVKRVSNYSVLIETPGRSVKAYLPYWSRNERPYDLNTPNGYPSYRFTADGDLDIGGALWYRQNSEVPDYKVAGTKWEGVFPISGTDHDVELEFRTDGTLIEYVPGTGKKVTTKYSVSLTKLTLESGSYLAKFVGTNPYLQVNAAETLLCIYDRYESTTFHRVK